MEKVTTVVDVIEEALGVEATQLVRKNVEIPALDKALEALRNHYSSEYVSAPKAFQDEGDVCFALGDNSDFATDLRILGYKLSDADFMRPPRDLPGELGLMLLYLPKVAVRDFLPSHISGRRTSYSIRNGSQNRATEAARIRSWSTLSLYIKLQEVIREGSLVLIPPVSEPTTALESPWKEIAAHAGPHSGYVKSLLSVCGHYGYRPLFDGNTPSSAVDQAIRDVRGIPETAEQTAAIPWMSKLGIEDLLEIRKSSALVRFRNTVREIAARVDDLDSALDSTTLAQEAFKDAQAAVAKEIQGSSVLRKAMDSFMNISIGSVLTSFVAPHINSTWSDAHPMKNVIVPTAIEATKIAANAVRTSKSNEDLRMLSRAYGKLTR